MQLGGSRFFRQLDSTSPVDCCRRRKDGSGAKLQTATVVAKRKRDEREREFLKQLLMGVIEV